MANGGHGGHGAATMVSPREAQMQAQMERMQSLLDQQQQELEFARKQSTFSGSPLFASPHLDSSSGSRSSSSSSLDRSSMGGAMGDSFALSASPSPSYAQQRSASMAVARSADAGKRGSWLGPVSDDEDGDGDMILTLVRKNNAGMQSVHRLWYTV
jgi:hypothetical protein